MYTYMAWESGQIPLVFHIPLLLRHHNVLLLVLMIIIGVVWGEGMGGGLIEYTSHGLCDVDGRGGGKRRREGGKALHFSHQQYNREEVYLMAANKFWIIVTT